MSSHFLVPKPLVCGFLVCFEKIQQIECVGFGKTGECPGKPTYLIKLIDLPI